MPTPAPGPANTTDGASAMGCGVKSIGRPTFVSGGNAEISAGAGSRTRTTSPGDSAKASDEKATTLGDASFAARRRQSSKANAPATSGIPNPSPTPKPTASLLSPESVVLDEEHTDVFTSTTTHASPASGFTTQLVAPLHAAFAGHWHAALAAAPSGAYRHSVPAAQDAARRLVRGSPDSFTRAPGPRTSRKLVTADTTGTLLLPAGASDVPSAMANPAGYTSPTTVSSITPGTATKGKAAVQA